MTGSSETIQRLDPETRKGFRRLILSLADTKRILGIRYSDWLLGAPSIEAGIAVSSMAQDEWGHARLLYSVLKDFGDDPLEVEHSRDASAYASVDTLDRPFPDWSAVVVGMVVVDGVLSSALEGAGSGAYEPLSGRVSKMLAEEEFHGELGRAWLRRIAESSGVGRARLRERVEEVLLPTLRGLLPTDPLQGRLVEAGLTASSQELRDRVREAVTPSLELLELEFPVVEGQGEGWDPDRGRGPGHPLEEAVERARGDRNRALFVE